ncbi:MAG: hypothetical protein QOK43_1576 [Acidimicrobiaceae bacterium]|nr:hypothetical protein [Acidimicrobiaceae bacterium]MDQ1444504.1 hypothetical protein [Acidimicrobiaceae bacterium]
MTDHADPADRADSPDLLAADVLIVNQKAKLIELTNEYTIRDPQGQVVGSVRQEGQSKARKVVRALTRFDQFMSVRLGVYDAGGALVLSLTRPAKLMKSSVEVADGGGAAVGRIVQQNVIGKIRFGLEDASGAALGQIRAENWRAWDFAILDPAEREVGRISKKWAGLGKELFTTADNYVLEVSDATVSPGMRKLMLAAAAAIDTALKQNE